ncbi:MAG: tyrosine--tRNA ligase [Candidatus Zambryskibacteria bacterium RIFCSPHIGHO2_01_FULL_49_18]|uniref:Tyrosine--tRNA ligase n=2 Tax=Candidatus Zambryskiibacteriota TaxID=1817925 RepID=A0A1G2T432_9BACT|nr:MAG: tyrosine--tRNA ligase [Candidatus Zambryskibacteria bacterium RIFCSPHIGHO2_01_FULL_49_18]OHB05907.1 MAG: tyrosine--tRNA ligase [Candidatus Zambryskibacteria bacterium RIFCSPLOWO2_01_FULL_47_14]
MDKDVEELLSRSVKEIIPSKEALKEFLESGKKLRIYIGTDPTGASLHLGHATNYMILEKFRRLGHEVIFLVGDFTARIGDPTDKSDSARKQLSREEVVENTKTWIDQVRPIIDVDKVKVLYNHDWLSKLSLEDFIKLSSNFTAPQLLERDMFQERLKSGNPLYFHELFYPLMQGYDSVAMDVDMEMCGNDQKFNALAGRTLLKKLKNKEKFVFITTLLENPKTGEKMMSKSQGTGVFLDWDSNRMFGGIMAQPDENMGQLFTDCTWLGLEEIDEILKNHPKEAKMRLAFEITKIYHSEEKAIKAQENFEQTFSKGGIPKDIKTVTAGKDTPLAEILLEHGVVSSKTEFNRLNKDGAIEEMENGVYRVGKHRFLKITRSD